MMYAKPVDFADFWRAALEEVRPLAGNEPEREPWDVFAGDLAWPALEAERLTFRGVGGVRFRALLQRPISYPGRRPALVHFPGYDGHLSVHVDAGVRGYVALEVNPRGMLWATDDFTPGPPGIIARGLEDPLTYAYRAVYQDCCQAVWWLLGQDFVDPGRVGMWGTSQGGGLTLATAALTQAARAVACDLPFLCDFSEANDRTRWGEVAEYIAAHPERREQVLRTLSYFDAVHMAGEIACPALFTIGRQDQVCPAVSIRKAFAAVQGDRALIEIASLGHQRSADYRYHALQWFDWYLR